MTIAALVWGLGGWLCALALAGWSLSLVGRLDAALGRLAVNARRRNRAKAARRKRTDDLHSQLRAETGGSAEQQAPDRSGEKAPTLENLREQYQASVRKSLSSHTKRRFPAAPPMRSVTKGA